MECKEHLSGMKLVTVGVCARNSEDTIRPALESALDQDFPHNQMEIIFVDDGSQDSTPRIMHEYTDKTNIESRIFSEGWRGLGKARNTIIDNATGKYIVWLDSDEILERHFLRKQVNLMEHNPEAGIATARLGIVAEENPILVLDLIPSVVEYSSQDWQNPTKLPGTGGATYRVTAARQVNGFDEDIAGSGEDIDIASRIRQAGWSIIRGDAVFYEKHGKMATWSSLWKRYLNQGIHGRRLYRKNDLFFSLYRMNPLASFVASLRYAVTGYRLTGLKMSILLPFHFTFKMTAWFYGFARR